MFIFYKTHQKYLYFLIGLVAALMAFAACGSSPTPGSKQNSDTSPPAVDPTPTPMTNGSSQATVTPLPGPTPTSTIKLTLWTLEEISFLTEDQEVSNFLTEALNSFELNNPDIEVNVLVKKASGKGGVLDFLRTARDVAPSVLPDVVVMDATDLAPANVDGLVQPLDGKLDRAIVQDLLPAARRVGTVDDNLVGVPLAINMEHAVFNKGVFSEAPITWTTVLSANSRYLFPAKGVNGLVNDATLAQYFSAGGELVSDEGRPKIDERVLSSVLRFYELALQNGTIDANLLEAATPEELWPNYLAGKAGIAQLSVSQYLTDRDLLNNSAVTGLPVQDASDTQVSVMHARVLALVSQDPARQDAALKLMETLVSTSNNARWSEIKKSIPVRDTAYRRLAGDDPYWQFLTGLLNTARPEPRFAGYDRVGRILQQALEQVINGEATAEEATSTAIDALAQ